METKEICTLQFGHFSNFIGTHWWNCQELGFSYKAEEPTEINHSVLYREGQTLKGEVTFTPRLLLVDLNGSLGTLPEQGDLYGTPSEDDDHVLWDDKLVHKEKAKIKVKNDFLQDLEESPSNIENKNYNFEESVEVWSDYLYARYHPKTTNIIKEYQRDDVYAGFNAYTQGRNLWKTEQFDEDFCDKIRNFVEECDNMQGFHILFDITNGFSGLSNDCIEYLRDEYDRKSVLAIPVLPSHHKDYNFVNEEEERKSQILDSVRIVNLALSFVNITENSSLFVPLCTNKNGWRKPGPKREFHRLIYDDKLMYHTSAILAAALDTFTLKYRLKGNTHYLGDLCKDLSRNGRKVAAASLCLPFSFNKDDFFSNCLENWDGPLSQSISPNCIVGTDNLMQFSTIRGIPENRLKKPESQHKFPQNTIQEMLSFYYSCATCYTDTDVAAISKGLTVRKPFPNFFHPSVGVDGNIQATWRGEHQYATTVPVLSGLHSGNEVGEMIESLHVEANKIQIGRFHQFTSTGLEKDEYRECLDKLFDLGDCYSNTYVI